MTAPASRDARRSPKPSDPSPAAAPAPAAWRDPWAWASALAVLPLVLHSLGAPLGEPVAEDFDFLRHNLLLGRHGLLDGGGSEAFWRPVSHQLYYTLLGNLILDHPGAVAALHAVLLAVSALLLYRALRRWWSGPLAAAAASFPFLMESARTVLSWPSHGVELGSLLFAALALHEAAYRRLGTCLVALALGLLSKELVVVTAALIPLLPAPAGERVAPRERVRWALAIGALGAVWAGVYLGVRHAQHLALPHQLESDPSALAVPLAQRLIWATWNSLRALLSLPAVTAPSNASRALALVAIAVVVVGSMMLALRRTVRARARSAAPWIAWGLAWFALSSAALTTIYPFWAPNRALFGSVGLGIAMVAVLGAAAPALAWALLAARLALFAVSPGPSRAIDVQAPATGAFMDFEQLTRLQRLMRDTREALVARYPRLPRAALVGQHNLPRRAEYAFGGDHALQCWYRDTTLRWVRFESYSRDSTIPLATIAEYQLGYVPSVALVEPQAMRDLLAGSRRMQAEDLVRAESLFVAAEREQNDPAARVFLGTVVGMRSGCRMGLGHPEEAIREGRRALAIYRENTDARYAIAFLLAKRGDTAGAAAELDTLLAISPNDQDARALRERIVSGR